MRLQKLLLATFALLCVLGLRGQTYDVQYLNPTGGFVNSTYKYIRFGSAQEYWAGIMHNISSTSGYGNGNDITLFTYGNRDLNFRTGTGNFIIFPSAGGKVGIGTNSPSAKLHVHDGGISINGTNPTTSVNGFNNAIQLQNSEHAAIVYNSGEPTELMFGFHTNGNFYWGTGASTASPSNTYSMWLNSKTSNLGIKGKLTASEVKVKVGGWADFVFEDTYYLPKIEDVENYIKINKHLPNIPSEEEVKKNGVALGEMDAKLLQKIEELTLYVILQQKEISSLKSENKELKKLAKDIEELKTLLKIKN